MTTEPIKIEGLAEFSRNLRKLDNDLPKQLRVALNEATETVAGRARQQVPARTGRARRSVVARSTRTAARIQGGSQRVPYYPWLDFGGRVGRNRSVNRPFLAKGRYIYKAYDDHRAEFVAALERALLKAAASAGIQVD